MLNLPIERQAFKFLIQSWEDGFETHSDGTTREAYAFNKLIRKGLCKRLERNVYRPTLAGLAYHRAGIKPKIIRETLRDKLVTTIQQHPGLTSVELAQLMAGDDGYIRNECKKLENDGVLRHEIGQPMQDDGQEKQGGGRPPMIWFISEEQLPEGQ